MGQNGFTPVNRPPGLTVTHLRRRPWPFLKLFGYRLRPWRRWIMATIALSSSIRRTYALFPASEAEGNIVSITRRGRHRPSAFGVSFLRCDVTFSTLHHITHEKPKPPAIEEKYPHTFLFVMRNCHSEAQWGSDLNSYITNSVSLSSPRIASLSSQGRLGARTSLPRH